MNGNRREFLAAAAAWMSAEFIARRLNASRHSRERLFKISLACGPLGAKVDFPTSIKLAAQHGFEAIEPRHGPIHRMSSTQKEQLLHELRTANLVWGSTSLPVNIRATDETEFASQLKQFPAIAKSLADVGVTRLRTFIRPHHAELTYRQNFKQHVNRITRIGRVAADFGLRVGLEYVGTRHLLNAARFPFIHTLTETRELISETGQNNVGVVLDSWHWYVAEESKTDLLALTNAEIVACDLNDAPRGIAVTEQLDYARELPAATGVIDLTTFLGALVQTGFDGPVRCEPFNQQLRAMDAPAAIAATADAMRRAVALIPKPRTDS